MNKHEIKWDKLIPFETITPPDFPVEALPKPVAEFVNAISESIQTSPEMAGVLALGALATCVQQKYELVIDSDYKEPLSLYTFAVAAPSERKTAVAKKLIEPIEEYEKQYNQKNRRLFAISKSKKEQLKKTLDKLINNPNTTDEELARASYEFSEFKEIYPLKLLSNDITPAKTKTILCQQQGRLAISADEGGIIEAFESSEIDIYLNGFSNSGLNTERMGRSECLEKTSISFILTAQPKILNILTQNSRLKGKGLTARFLYASCQSMLGKKKSRKRPTPEYIKENYKNVIFQLLEKDHRKTKYLSLSAEAKEAYYNFEDKINNILFENKDSGHMLDYYGKNHGIMLRIAGVIHCVLNEEPDETEVSLETINNAIKIIDCLNVHAEKIFENNIENEGNCKAEKLNLIIDKLKDLHEKEISVNEIYQRHFRRKFNSIKEFRAHLVLLEDLNYIILYYEKNNVVGRPREYLIVNPKIYS